MLPLVPKFDSADSFSGPAFPEKRESNVMVPEKNETDLSPSQPGSLRKNSDNKIEEVKT